MVVTHVYDERPPIPSVIAPCDSKTPRQVWTFNGQGNIVNGDNQCVEVPDCYTGGSIQNQIVDLNSSATCQDGANRRWKFVVSEDRGDVQLGHIVSMLDSKFCLGVIHGIGPYVATAKCQAAGKDEAQLWTYNKATKQLKVFNYCLAPLNDGALLDVWAGPLSDGSTAAVLFNRGTLSHNVTAKFSDLGLGHKCVVRDLWARKDVGTFDGSYTATLRPHQSTMVKLSCM